MKMNVNIGLEQILDFIRQLPFNEKEKLVSEIQKERNVKSKTNQLQKVLLQGPTWSEKEYKNYLKTRVQLNRFPDNDSH